MTGKLKIVFFGKLAELAKTHLHSNSIFLECQRATTPAEVIKQIATPFPELINELQQANTLFAINHDMAKANSQISAGDELAIMPPVSGG